MRRPSLFVMPLLGEIVMSKKHVFITGVSSGLGYGLAYKFIKLGYKVFGCSRRTPNELIDQGLNFCCLDLEQQSESQEQFSQWIQEVASFDFVFLNAGVLGEIKDMQECRMNYLKRIMEINVWSNKWIMDELFSGGRLVEQLIAISSGASLSGSRGWNGYSLSKAALNMLIKLYAGENPKTHFIALAPGLIDTAMQDYLTAIPSDPRYAPIEVLKAAKGTDRMPTGMVCAEKIISALPKLRDFESGSYADIRKL